MKRTAICFLTVAPKREFFTFCDSLVNERYDVYICVDKPFHQDFDSLCKIIQIPSEVAENAGFKGSVIYFSNQACSRDKALFYFCSNFMPYERVWFIEEDVFIPTADTLSEIDNKYPSGDLLAPSHFIFKKQTFFQKNTWYWNHIHKQTKLNYPFAASMICAIRVSKKLLYAIRQYAQKFKSLFLDEVMFNTIALHAGLKVVVARDELHYTILHKHAWVGQHFSKHALYHPIKDTDRQHKLRETLR